MEVPLYIFVWISMFVSFYPVYYGGHITIIGLYNVYLHILPYYIVKTGMCRTSLLKEFSEFAIFLTLSSLGKIFSRQHFDFFFFFFFSYFSQKTGFDISCNLHEMSTPVFLEK